MILVIDYGMGNLRSVTKAFEIYSNNIIVSSDPKLIQKADKIILPGVGAFGDAMLNLKKMGIEEELRNWFKHERPFIGICLGMQLLFDTSTEKGDWQGLSCIEGKVVRFPKTELKVPHIGWNKVHQNLNGDLRLFKGVKDSSYFYHVHSYYCSPKNKNEVSGLAEYGISFVNAVAKNNVFGVQFHPEKSQESGLKLVENFCLL